MKTNPQVKTKQSGDKPTSEDKTTHEDKFHLVTTINEDKTTSEDK